VTSNLVMSLGKKKILSTKTTDPFTNRERNMYTVINFPSKKKLKEAVAAGQQVRIFAPGLGTPVENGQEFLEGPHFPSAHTWYARVEMKDGIVIKLY
jgi:hypothetical protein